MPNSEHRRDTIETLAALISDVPIAMLVTSTSQHALRSRPMVNINVKFEGELWFFTKADDPKVNEYWDAKAGVMQEFSGLVRRVLSGSMKAEKKSELEHESIDWQQPAKAPGVGK